MSIYTNKISPKEKSLSLVAFSANKYFLKSCRKFKIYFLLSKSVLWHISCTILRWNGGGSSSYIIGNKAWPFNLIYNLLLLFASFMTQERIRRSGLWSNVLEGQEYKVYIVFKLMGKNTAK